MTEGHKPCGMGGPKDKYGNGWYSEIEMGKVNTFSSNETLKRYLCEEWKNSQEYRPCFVPAFWLSIAEAEQSYKTMANEKADRKYLIRPAVFRKSFTAGNGLE